MVVNQARPEVADEIRGMASELARAMGLEVVDLRLRASGRRWLLRVSVDRPGPKGIGIDDCERLSKLLSESLDQADLLAQSYTLEVSSPGLDRPIRTPDDVRRNTGRRVVVETLLPVEGRRSFRGVLLGLDGEAVRLMEEGGAEVRIPRGGILKAQQEATF